MRHMMHLTRAIFRVEIKPQYQEFVNIATGIRCKHKSALVL